MEEQREEEDEDGGRLVRPCSFNVCLYLELASGIRNQIGSDVTNLAFAL